jgi:hypothetical protein
MPRYEMSEAEVEALASYLAGLTSTLPPGITETTIHFATIVSENSDLADREAMLGILNAFVRDKNSNSRNESGRAARGAYYRDSRERAYRRWVLHPWVLKGPSKTWPGQLDKLYRAQPVFAMVGGVGKGAWRPVHDFCESRQIPCLFPITDQPVVDEEGFYSIYISGGLFQEAGAATRYLDELLAANSPPVVQIYNLGSEGEVMAGRIRQAATAREWAVRDIPLLGGAEPTQAFWEEQFAGREDSVFLVWLSAADRDFLQEVPLPPKAKFVFSETITGPEVFDVSGKLREQTRILSILDLPEGREKSLARLRAWLNPRGISLSSERVQADTYLSATLVASATKHMRENFSREYLIEIIEHGLDNTVFRSVYPRLSLGPNQRIASKRSFVLRPSNTSSSDWAPVGTVITRK